ncbi:MAG: DNA primase [Candidatus Onthovivens sp.]|nr:DNA primase [Candidatus Onthovivens sp.]
MDNSLHDLSLSVLKNSDIVEVISSRIKVIKVGRNYKAVCPFHDDKNPSLMISKEKQIFKCFVCGASGNAISFIQKYDKISFFEAVREVAKISGYNDERLTNLNQPKVSVNNEYSDIYNCLNEIANFYEISLYQSEVGKKGLEYLKNRGLNDDVIHYFRIGYSLDDGENIINYLKAKNFSIKTIERTGIGRINNQTLTIRDNNAGRIIFPLISKNDQVLGFSARRIVNDDTAKYINTESTLVFNKGNLLYNLNKAKNEAKQVNYVYLVEGFMDVIALYRINIKSAVALMGTALTKDQIKELRLLNVEVRICLDLDNAGQMNTLSVINKLEEAGIDFKVVNNKVDFNEKDSDEILTKYGEEKLKSFLFNLIDSGEWILNYYTKTLNLANTSDKKILVQKVMPYIAKLKSKFDVEAYINKLSFQTGFSKSLLMEYLTKFKEKNLNSDDELFIKEVTSPSKKISKIDLAQFKILKYMLEDKVAIDIVNSSNLYFPTEKYRELAGLLIDYVTSLSLEQNTINADEIINYIQSNENLENKDKLSNSVSEIVLNEEIKIPPFTKSELEESINSLNTIRQTKRYKQTIREIEHSSNDPIKNAKSIQSLLEKMKQK